MKQNNLRSVVDASYTLKHYTQKLCGKVVSTFDLFEKIMSVSNGNNMS